MASEQNKSKSTLTALVTGGSGFIGSELIRKLNARGFKVRALMRKTSLKDNLKDSNYEEAIGDLSDLDSLKNAVKGVDYVFHVAGVISANHAEDYFKYNEKGTGLLAKAVSDENANLKRFIYISSIAAGGPSHNLTPRIETDFEDPVSIYGKSKLGGERQLIKISEERFPISIVRPPIVYGPRDKGFFEVLKVAAKGISPIMASSNTMKQKYYSLVHVDDLIDGIIEAAVNENQGRREIYYITDGKVYGWNEITDALEKVFERKLFRFHLPLALLRFVAFFYMIIGRLTGVVFPLTFDKINEIKPDFWICSNDKARRVLGYFPKQSLEQGLKSTVDWYKSEKWL